MDSSARLRFSKQLKNAKRLFQNVTESLAKEKNEVAKAMRQLQNEQEQFQDELKRVQLLVDASDLIRLNIGGKTIVTRQKTLTKVENSNLAEFFNSQSPNRLYPNPDGRFFFDYNSFLFTHLLDQLRILQSNDTPVFRPPFSPLTNRLFYQMLRELGLLAPQRSDNDIIVLNVRGEKIATLRKTLAGVEDPKIASWTSDSKEGKRDQLGRPFLDYDPSYIRAQLERSRTGNETFYSSTTTTRS